MLTDVHGPRLTGSPNLKAAGEWAIEQMHAWGLKNGHLDPWNFGYPGWTNERLAAYIVSPVKDTLVAEALAWTPGTKGAVKGAAMQMTLPRQPTQRGTRGSPRFIEGRGQGKDRPGERSAAGAGDVQSRSAPARGQRCHHADDRTAGRPAGRGGGPPAQAAPDSRHRRAAR